MIHYSVTYLLTYLLSIFVPVSYTNVVHNNDDVFRFRMLSSLWSWSAAVALMVLLPLINAGKLIEFHAVVVFNICIAVC